MKTLTKIALTLTIAAFIPGAFAQFIVTHEQANAVAGTGALNPKPDQPYYVAFDVISAAAGGTYGYTGFGVSLASWPPAQIYYTTDGSLPSVDAAGLLQGSTQKVSAAPLGLIPLGLYACVGPRGDTACVGAAALQYFYSATIPPQPNGTVVHYIVSATNNKVLNTGLPKYKQFANTNCPSAACATVFTYIVGQPVVCDTCSITTPR